MLYAHYGSRIKWLHFLFFSIGAHTKRKKREKDGIFFCIDLLSQIDAVVSEVVK